jgi:hypothetical protein
MSVADVRSRLEQDASCEMQDDVPKKLSHNAECDALLHTNYMNMVGDVIA